MKDYEFLSPSVNNFSMELPEIAILVKEAREKKEFTQQQVADYLGIGLRNYQHLEAGRFPKYKTQPIKTLEKHLGIKIYDKIYDTTNQSAQTEVTGSILTGVGRNPKKPGQEYLEKRRALKGKSEPFMVPMVNIKTQAGYARSFNNTDYINQLDLYPIVPNIDPRGAVWRYFEVQGDSMEPKLFETDLVLVSMVPYEDWGSIKSGEVYVVITEDDVLIKKIVIRAGDSWVLESLNKRHKQRLVRIADIKELWYYRRRITK